MQPACRLHGPTAFRCSFMGRDPALGKIAALRRWFGGGGSRKGAERRCPAGRAGAPQGAPVRRLR
eukprot:365750-Chlamydomonas_euryale.AAC.12